MNMYTERICQVINCIFTNRHTFDENTIRRIEDDREYVFSILPYVARSFSLSMMVLPEKLLMPSALGYCYCRILDTFEDMLSDPYMRVKALKLLPKQLKKLNRGKKIDNHYISNICQKLVCSKEKDKAYCLLVEQIERLHRLFMVQDPNVQLILLKLVQKMSKGMCRFSTLFKEDDTSISKKDIKSYCKSVLGYPLIFLCQLTNWYKGHPDYMNVKYKKEIIDISQFIQLANITRDVEEDLLNHVVYHNLLSSHKYSVSKKDLLDPVMIQKIKEVRRELIMDAIYSSYSYPLFMEEYFMGNFCTRLSMLIFLKFTEIYYRNSCTKHFNIGKKKSIYVMIIICVLASLSSHSSNWLVKIRRLMN